MTLEHVSKAFSGWLEKYDEDQAHKDVHRYLNARTGLLDREQARFDDMLAAFSEGILYAQSVARKIEKESK